MNDALLLDTHIAIWLDGGDIKLRPATRAMIDECWRTGGTIYFSAVSAWEIAVLVDKGFLGLDVPTDQWVARFLDRPGIEPIALDHAAAVRAYELHHFQHKDPADRLLVSSAIELGCPLVTYDDRILRFGRSRGKQYGFATA